MGCYFAPWGLCVRLFLLRSGVLENAVNKHRDRPREEQNGARADGEIPEPLALAGELDAHVDHREADAVEGMQNHGGEQADFGEFEQWRTECFEGFAESFWVLQFVDGMNVQDQIADERDAGQ